MTHRGLVVLVVLTVALGAIAGAFFANLALLRIGDAGPAAVGTLNPRATLVAGRAPASEDRPRTAVTPDPNPEGPEDDREDDD